MFDYITTASAVPELKVGDVSYNTAEIIKKINEAKEKKTDVVCFGELCITGYTCADLFFQKTLIKSVKEAIMSIAEITDGICAIVGAPIEISSQLFNCAVIICNRKICGIVPKTFLPEYNEFYEKRWFSNSESLPCSKLSSSHFGFGELYDIPVGANLLFNISNDITFGVEICEDMTAPVSRGSLLALGGAELIFNLSASSETTEKRAMRTDLIKVHSLTSLCAYQYTSTGIGESTTDLVFSGHTIFSECGKILAENNKTVDGGYLLVNDFDIGKVRAERIKNKTFSDGVRIYRQNTTIVYLPELKIKSRGDNYPVTTNPFIMNPKNILSQCLDIFEMQTAGLAKRIKTVGGKMIVGVSGGLDSTMALLVCVNTAHMLNKPLSDVIGITMPCFGTSDKTHSNSLKLMNALGITSKEINIKNACLAHFSDIGHDVNKLDLTYENAQARERTQVLMDYAGEVGGLVIGTGDLSEAALGWCTYNGDHMSMYSVNSGIPKTLLSKIISSIIEKNLFPEANEVLQSIIDTPISPELLPPDASGNISQTTEDIVGPYELHDFFLFYILRYGFEPAKIYHIAKKAFSGKYENEIVLKWLKNFYRRFFTQQFKRSCQPDGIKVCDVSLSPRGDWKMPSDASFVLWSEEVENLQ